MAAALVALFLSPLVAAGAVETANLRTLASGDLGLQDFDRDVRTDLLVAVGLDGGAYRMNDAGRLTETISTETTDDLLAVGVHPRGTSALLGGENGTFLRYTPGAGVEVIAPGPIGTRSITAIDWVASAQRAVLGTLDGHLLHYDAAGSVALIDDSSSSRISSVACHAEVDTCVAISESDGIAVIGRDRQARWLGDAGIRWFDAACSDDGGDTCVAVGSGLRHRRIDIDVAGNGENAELIGQVKIVQEVDGDFAAISSHAGQRLLVALFAPFGLVELDARTGEVYTYLDQADVPVGLGGSRILGSWSSDSAHGTVITARGELADWQPPPESGPFEGGVALFLAALIVITVPGTILGLIYMNSPRMQAAYLRWRRRRKPDAGTRKGDRISTRPNRPGESGPKRRT